jgi:hypothetical protein
METSRPLLSCDIGLDHWEDTESQNFFSEFYNIFKTTCNYSETYFLSFVLYKFLIFKYSQRMKQTQKKLPSQDKGVMSRINDNPDQEENIVPSDKKKGVIAKVNDKTNKGKK